MNNKINTIISFIVNTNNVNIFFPILQKGFMVKVKTGYNIKTILCDQLYITPDYVSNRIKTFLLNSKPVDDIESVFIKENSTLALSAAMPGLVGATFRSNGPLTAFRSSITHMSENNKSCESHEGVITLKLFNLLVTELGPGFLKQGILIKAGELKNLFKDQKTKIFKSIKKNEKDIDLNSLNKIIRNNELELILIKVFLL